MSHYYAYQEALKEFLAGDPLQMAERSGAIFHAETKTFSLNYCNQIYQLNHQTGNIAAVQGGEAAISDQILFYQYLVQASGLPLADKWISYLELPNGEHHYVPFKLEAMVPLAKTFGYNLSAFKDAAQRIGGLEIKMGHLGYKIPALPRIPIAVALWEGDEEFPPSANVIFDASAKNYLTPAALYVLGINVTRKMCGAMAF